MADVRASSPSSYRRAFLIGVEFGGSSNKTAGTAATTSAAESDGKAAESTAYVACMRQNGVAKMPGPVNGMFNYDAISAKFKAAQKICSKYLPSNAPPPPS